VFWQGQNVSTRPRGLVGGLSDFGACEAWFGHAAGDLFVLLDGDGVTRRPFSLDRLGDTFHYPRGRSRR
jgi:hypothetical protein